MAFDLLYAQKIIHKIAIVLIIAGAINWLFIGAAGINLVEKIFGYRSPYAKGVYLLVGIAALTVMFHRDTYLPFLGETVMPCSALPEQIPEGADTQVQVDAPAGAKVLYWAAEHETEGMKKIQDWRQAYMKFMNVGVVLANGDGKATLYVRKPQAYTVPMAGRLEPHIHYRICGEGGMLASIKTVFLSDGRTEAFVDY
jgi:uncharacterized membrane protein YuzA (DUF378 family)